MTPKRSAKRKKLTLRELAQPTVDRLAPGDTRHKYKLTLEAVCYVRASLHAAFQDGYRQSQRDHKAASKASVFRDKLRNPGESSADAARRFNEVEVSSVLHRMKANRKAVVERVKGKREGAKRK